MNELSKPAQAGHDAGDVLLAFSSGALSRQRAMDALGVGYGDLLDQLAERHLHLPRLPDAEVQRMAAKMLELLGPAHR